MVQHNNQQVTGLLMDGAGDDVRRSIGQSSENAGYSGSEENLNCAGHVHVPCCTGQPENASYFGYSNWEPLVTRWELALTGLGLLLYVLDMLSDIGSAIYYAYYREWWQYSLTLLFIYAPTIVSTARKLINHQLQWTGSVDGMRYFGLLLVNWIDLMQYWRLFRLERQIHRSPDSYAHLILEWQQRRHNVALVKFMEGLYEACPQAILQLYFLLLDLHGDLTWTDYLRITSSCLSLCTAGAALVNWEKYLRILDNIDLPIHELLVLHVWAVPVTASRLLSVALLLTVNLYWGLVCIALHMLLFAVYWYRIWRIRRTQMDVLYVSRIEKDVFDVCVFTLRYFLSPFCVSRSKAYCCVVHVIHFLCNTGVTVMWALVTPLLLVHPALYMIIIYFNCTMFIMGLLDWMLHKK